MAQFSQLSFAAGRELEHESGTYLFMVPWELDNPGGVSQVVINLYYEFERTGPFRPLVLVLDWDCISVREWPSAGCEAVHMRVVEAPGGKISILRALRYLARLPFSLYRLRKLIARYKVRVVNAHYPTLASFNILLLKELGLFRGKLLLSFHGLDIRNIAKCTGMERMLWHWLVRGADALVSCSDSLATEIRAYDKQVAGTVVTVRNGVDPDALREEMARVSTTHMLLPTGVFILNVATFEHKKGQDVLVRAFSHIADRFPDVELVIIGRDGLTRTKIEALVTELGLERRVICIPDMSHAAVLTYIANSAIFVLPSRMEPLGIAILEAGAFGKPVVASRVGGIPEIIDSEECGILVDAEDVEKLAGAISALLIDRELRASIGIRLRERVTTKFTWREAAAKYRTLFARVAG